MVIRICFHKAHSSVKWPQCMFLCLVQQVMEAHLLKLLMGIREWTAALEGEQILKRCCCALDNHVAWPVCQPAGVFCSLKRYFISVASYYSWCKWRFVVCETSVLTLFKAVKLCTFFFFSTLTVELHIQSIYTDWLSKSMLSSSLQPTTHSPPPVVCCQMSSADWNWLCSKVAKRLLFTLL